MPIAEKKYSNAGKNLLQITTKRLQLRKLTIKSGGLRMDDATQEQRNLTDVAETCIELCLRNDGRITVSLDNNDEQKIPAKNLDDALRIIKQIAEGIVSGVNQDEDAAYKTEMASLGEMR